MYAVRKNKERQYFTEAEYERLKSVAIAILKQRAGSLYGLPVDRLIRACGIGWNRRLKPSHMRQRWAKKSQVFIWRLENDRILRCQKTFPLVSQEPWRCYLYDSTPPLQMTRSYSDRARKTERYQDAKLHPLKFEPLQKKQQQIKAEMMSVLEERVGWLTIPDYELSLKSNGCEFSYYRLTGVIHNLTGLGVLERKTIGNRIYYRPASSQQFASGDAVAECVGSQSERYGRVRHVVAMDGYVRLEVEWQDGSRSLSSSELCHKIHSDIAETVLQNIEASITR